MFVENVKKAIEFDEVHIAHQMRNALHAFEQLKGCMLDKPDELDWYRAGKAEALAYAAGAAFPAMSPLGLSFPVIRIAPLGLLFAMVDHFGVDPREKYEKVWSGLSDEQRQAVADSWLDWLYRWGRPIRQEISWPPRYFDGFWFHQVLAGGVAYVSPIGTAILSGEIVWLRGGRWSRSPFNSKKEEPLWLAGIISKLNEEISK